MIKKKHCIHNCIQITDEFSGILIFTKYTNFIQLPKRAHTFLDKLGESKLHQPSWLGYGSETEIDDGGVGVDGGLILKQMGNNPPLPPWALNPPALKWIICLSQNKTVSKTTKVYSVAKTRPHLFGQIGRVQASSAFSPILQLMQDCSHQLCSFRRHVFSRHSFEKSQIAAGGSISNVTIRRYPRYPKITMLLDFKGCKFLNNFSNSFIFRGATNQTKFGAFVVHKQMTPFSSKLRWPQHKCNHCGQCFCFKYHLLLVIHTQQLQIFVFQLNWKILLRTMPTFETNSSNASFPTISVCLVAGIRENAHLLPRVRSYLSWGARFQQIHETFNAAYIEVREIMPTTEFSHRQNFHTPLSSPTKNLWVCKHHTTLNASCMSNVHTSTV